MAVFRNVMVYLGLGPDEEYEDGYFSDDQYRSEDQYGARASSGTPASVGAHDAEPRFDDTSSSVSAVGAVRPLRSVDEGGRTDTGGDVLDLTEPAERGYSEPSFDIRSGVDGRSGLDNRSGFDHGTQATATRVEPMVKAVPISRSKPKTLSPDSFADAKLIADEFKNSVPVIMNLQGLDRELARRLIDFASGVCYAMGGSMEKIASQVFLVIPKSVEVSDEDRRRIEERGFAG